jgi:hypothetical protein
MIDFTSMQLFSATFFATITGFPVGLKEVGRVGPLACGIPPFSFGRTRVHRHRALPHLAASKLAR